MFGKRNKERWRGQPWQPRAEWGEEGRRSPEPRASARSGTRGTARRTKVGDGARTRHGEGRIFPTEIAAAPFELGAGSASSFRGKFTESFARALSAAATRSARRGMSAPAHLDERRTAAPILPPTLVVQFLAWTNFRVRFSFSKRKNRQPAGEGGGATTTATQTSAAHVSGQNIQITTPDGQVTVTTVSDVFGVG